VTGTSLGPGRALTPQKMWGNLGIASLPVDGAGSSAHHRLDSRRVVPMHQLDRVDVRSRYIGAWGAGFEIAEETGVGYRIRRLSDGALLPGDFLPDDIRRAEQ
jgi:hypothetical protein